MDKWLPSITMLLEKMATHLEPIKGRFNPILKRSFHDTFSIELPLNYDELNDCYQRHQQRVYSYFEGRDNLLTIDISKQDSLLKMKQFLEMEEEGCIDFPKLNIGRNVANWKDYKHPNKISSNLAGVDHRKYFDFYYAANK
jgi:hypothetical protein